MLLLRRTSRRRRGGLRSVLEGEVGEEDQRRGRRLGIAGFCAVVRSGAKTRSPVTSRRRSPSTVREEGALGIGDDGLKRSPATAWISCPPRLRPAIWSRVLLTLLSVMEGSVETVLWGGSEAGVGSLRRPFRPVCRRGGLSGAGSERTGFARGREVREDRCARSDGEEKGERGPSWRGGRSWGDSTAGREAGCVPGWGEVYGVRARLTGPRPAS